MDCRRCSPCFRLPEALHSQEQHYFTKRHFTCLSYGDTEVLKRSVERFRGLRHPKISKVHIAAPDSMLRGACHNDSLPSAHIRAGSLKLSRRSQMML